MTEVTKRRAMAPPSAGGDFTAHDFNSPTSRQWRRRALGEIETLRCRSTTSHRGADQ
jgi:hypothetical protein